MSNPLNIGILISGRGSNMKALLETCADAAFPGTVKVVISNRPGAGGLQVAEAAGIKAIALDHKAYPDRPSFEAELTRVLEENGVELICLAGFMRLLTDGFVTHWHDKMINIHPSILPLYKGTDTHERVLADGGRVHGCTVHYVRPEMDAGPIIAQAVVPVHDTDTPDDLAARVLKAEHRLYPAALKLIAEGRVTIKNERAIIDGAPDLDQILFSIDFD